MKKILYHIPYPSGTGADRWIYEGWRDAFIDLGYEFYALTAFDDFKLKVETIRPDIFMTAVNLVNFEKYADFLLKLRAEGTKICMWVHWPLIPVCKNAEPYLANHSLVDLYFGERELEGMADFEEKVGQKYFVIPNAANKKLHFPTKPNQKYQYDLVYLGAKLPMKRWFIDNILLPISKKYKVGIFGPYWTWKDNTLRVLSKLSRYTKSRNIESWLNKMRIVIPAEEENQLYSSAKISLNFHEREKDGFQSHIIVNQRAFKIPACGGFQICDAVQGLRRYFNQDELVMADYSQKAWFELIEYYIHNDKEREQIRCQGSEKALANHTYHNRVYQLLGLIHKYGQGL